jgi:hypothetical protein
MPKRPEYGWAANFQREGVVTLASCSGDSGRIPSAGSRVFFLGKNAPCRWYPEVRQAMECPISWMAIKTRTKVGASRDPMMRNPLSAPPTRLSGDRVPVFGCHALTSQQEKDARKS